MQVETRETRQEEETALARAQGRPGRSQKEQAAKERRPRGGWEEERLWPRSCGDCSKRGLAVGQGQREWGPRSWIPRAQLPEDALRMLLAYVTVQING